MSKQTKLWALSNNHAKTLLQEQTPPMHYGNYLDRGRIATIFVSSDSEVVQNRYIALGDYSAKRPLRP